MEKIYPAQGPNIGKGKIKFYGKNFKSFSLAETTCRIGDAIGSAKVLEPGIMECTVENMPLVQGEEQLPAAVSLNNASWTQPTKDTLYTPYGIA